LPIFSIYRSGNLTEKKAAEIYADLNTALGVKVAIKFIGVALLIIFIITLVFFTYKNLQINKSERELSSSIIE
jgi:hypothetical protein